MSVGLRGLSGCCGCRKLTKEAHLRGPREGYLVDLWVRGDCCSHCGPKAWHDVHHTRREPDLGGTETASKDQMGSAGCSCRPIRRGGESCSPVMAPSRAVSSKGSWVMRWPGHTYIGSAPPSPPLILILSCKLGMQT